MKTSVLLLCSAAALVCPSIHAQSANGSTHGKPANGTPAATPSTGMAHANPNAHMPNPNASANSNAVQAILQKFDASRDQLVSARQALIDKLAAATTESERQAILTELRQEQQSMQDVQRQTAKEIRAELQALRRQRAGGG